MSARSEAILGLFDAYGIECSGPMACEGDEEANRRALCNMIIQRLRDLGELAYFGVDSWKVASDHEPLYLIRLALKEADKHSDMADA